MERDYTLCTVIRHCFSLSWGRCPDAVPGNGSGGMPINKFNNYTRPGVGPAVSNVLPTHGCVARVPRNWIFNVRDVAESVV